LAPDQRAIVLERASQRSKTMTDLHFRGIL
jgi:hypothetical protein